MHKSLRTEYKCNFNTRSWSRNRRRSPEPEPEKEPGARADRQGTGSATPSTQNMSILFFNTFRTMPAYTNYFIFVCPKASRLVFFIMCNCASFLLDRMSLSRFEPLTLRPHLTGLTLSCWLLAYSVVYLLSNKMGRTAAVQLTYSYVHC